MTIKKLAKCSVSNGAMRFQLDYSLEVISQDILKECPVTSISPMAFQQQQSIIAGVRVHTPSPYGAALKCQYSTQYSALRA